MTKPMELKPVAVSARAIRAGEILRLLRWVEPAVWTERMLTALIEGVKGGKWFSLIDKIHPEHTLAERTPRSPPTKELPEWITSRLRCSAKTWTRT